MKLISKIEKHNFLNMMMQKVTRDVLVESHLLLLSLC